jgi:adenine phosphoribosyltransferase
VSDTLGRARSAMQNLIVDVPDYPKDGVVFKDITPLLSDPEGFRAVVEALAQAGTEARGFLFAVPVALELGVGFVPVRKPGKLPRECHSEEYALEYGTDTLQMHTDAVGPEDRVLLVDDVLATGGTLAATRRLVESTGAQIVGAAVLMELSFLPGRVALGGVPCMAVEVI